MSTVLGPDGAAIPGVTVLVKGISLGGSTNADGRYELRVPPTATTLVFSYVGYESKQVAIDSQSSINVSLQTSDTGLDEVVVARCSMASPAAAGLMKKRRPATCLPWPSPTTASRFGAFGFGT